MISDPFFDGHGRLASGVVAARVKAGAPMPYELRRVIPEEVFYRFRQDCIRAPTFDDFMGVIRRYCELHGWGHAVTGQQTSVDSAEFLAYQVITLGGLLGGTPDVGAQRVLLFHLPSLMTSASSPVFVPNAAVSQGRPISPREEGNLPIAYAAPVDKYHGS